MGIGFGADINGLGAQGDPRGADVANPVTYPFTGLGGVTVDQQHAGERVYDINVDGVAQYGLYPDWIEDLGMVADAQQRRRQRSRTTWPAAPRPTCRCGSGRYGIEADSCRNPGLRKTVATVERLIQPGSPPRR